MASIGDSIRNAWSSLTFRVLLLLTLTIAPIGAIAVFQTSRLTETLTDRAEDGLLAASLKALTPERSALERALGAGEALSRSVPLQSPTQSACHVAISDVITGEDGYAFLGLFTPSGLNCTAGDVPQDVIALVENRATFTTTTPFVAVSDASDLTVIGQPSLDGETVRHYVLLSVDATPLALPADNDISPDAIALFTPGGDVVRATSELDILARSLPAETELSQLSMMGSQVFAQDAADGEGRVYTVMPVYRERLYALAVWQPNVAALPGAGVVIAPWLFPIFMWLATLTISYIAINRVVVRHVQHLGMHMRRFARNKMVPPAEMAERQPVEFSEINMNFRAMAEEIVQDQAELENAVHQKTLLLREVHHRVKNNLQLIASIMNMQIRRSDNKETTVALRRLQDRVLGLAAIHRQMYTAQSLDRVPAEDVVGSILDQVVRFQPSDEVAFSRDLAHLELVQDQAVPLALLTAEAATNAVENLGTNSKGERRLDVSLVTSDGGGAELRIRNTISAAEEADGVDRLTDRGGLGAQLIRAFARQLEGAVTTNCSAGIYELVLTFESVGQPQVGGSDDESHGSDSEGSEPGFPRASAASAST